MVTISVNNFASETITNILYEIGVKGVEIIDNSLSKEDKELLHIDYVDESLKNSESVKIKAYFSEEENINEIIEILEDRIKEANEHIEIGNFVIEIEDTDEDDWANNWKQYYKAFKITDKILIKPTWEDLGDFDASIVIEMDPGMAFGSGTHETTAMCIELLEEYVKTNSKVIDVGCGSGILGIAAAKLGAKYVECIDIDKAAVKTAKENVEVNSLQSNIVVKHGDLVENTTIKADIVVANIMADIVMLLTKDIKKILNEDGIFISSGIIKERYEDVKKKLEENNFEVIKKLSKGEWLAIVARNC